MQRGVLIHTHDIHRWPGVIYCSVLVKKCPGAHSTQWRSCSLFREILLESMDVGQSVTPDSQFLYTGFDSLSTFFFFLKIFISSYFQIIKGECTPSRNWACFVRYLAKKLSIILIDNAIVLQHFVMSPWRHYLDSLYATMTFTDQSLNDLISYFYLFVSFMACKQYSLE